MSTTTQPGTVPDMNGEPLHVGDRAVVDLLGHFKHGTISEATPARDGWASNIKLLLDDGTVVWLHSKSVARTRRYTMRRRASW